MSRTGKTVFDNSHGSSRFRREVSPAPLPEKKPSRRRWKGHKRDERTMMREIQGMKTTTD